MHERILSIGARRPRLINGLLDLEGAVHEPIGADATGSTGFSSSANAGDGRNLRANRNAGLPVQCDQEALLSCHSSTRRTDAKLPRGIVYRERGRLGAT